jgi:hypothetical protein
MAEEKRELGRLGPYVFAEGTFDPAEDTLKLGLTEPELDRWESPQGDIVVTDPKTGDIVGLVVFKYQERLWDGPIEVPVPPSSCGPSGRSYFLSMPAMPGGMCC